MARNAEAPEVLREPPGDDNCAMARFIDWLCRNGRVDVADYEELWRWSVDELEQFWGSLWEFFDVRASQPYSQVLANASMPGASWFVGARLNYAEQVFDQATPERPALVVAAEGSDPDELSWNELRRQVAALAQRLRDWGVRPGDRIGAYLPNIPRAVVGLLATASVGAVWSCCAPEYATQSVIDRLAQIEPTVLILTDGYRYSGRVVDRRAESAAIAQALPSVRHVISVAYAWEEPDSVNDVRWSDVVADDPPLVFEQVPFDHPLWILYSSGTTGLPKGIVHSHGGIVLEHLKWLGLHNDVGPGDRFFWYTTTAWMVWNVVVGSLLVGATAVLYDGSPTWPRTDAVWELAARTKSTYLGVSAGYVSASQHANLTPGAIHDLSAVRCILFGGSPLSRAGWHWIDEKVKPDVWLDSPSGGTDVCAPFVGGCPLKPVYAGEMQCRILGMRVEAWSDDGMPVTDEVGELVVTAPSPSMPLYIWGDTDGHRYRESYFDVFPGVWRHGDLITITDRGTAVIHGRSDSTINRHGIRMGSADIYDAVDQLPEIEESLVVGAELPDARYYMPLFVVLDDDVILNDDLKQRINDAIRTRCSPRHVPDEILEVPAIPHTLTGKRLEVPVKRLIQGVAVERAVNPGVVDNPDVLAFFVDLRHRLASTGVVR